MNSSFVFSNCLSLLPDWRSKSTYLKFVIKNQQTRYFAMGVSHLWPTISPVKQHKSLDSLQGETLAVDLSMWICESQAVKQMQGNVIKPFLRNLFFRVNHLLQLGIRLIFIIDGCPPPMKMETIQKRLNDAQKNNIGAWKKRHSRTRLNAFLKECCCLLECLGIPYLESYGEAESYCAFLNAEGIVDACLTDDGDAFLYGAKKIYRNFTMDSKDPHVETYNIKHIENQLNINRNHLIAFALLVGCDYLPKGVPHIGVETTLKLFRALGEKDVLSRLQEWRSMKSSEISNPLEANVRDKALSLPDFPHIEIIKEFLVPKDKLPKKDLAWKRPRIEKFQEIAVQKLEWTEEYALKKIIPLLTKWTMLEIIGVIPNKYHEECLVPEKILKTRIQKRIPCFEIKWKPSDVTDENADKFISVEEQKLFTKCYPDLVEQFSSLQISKHQVKKKESQKKTSLIKKNNMQQNDNVLLDFEKLSLYSCGLSENGKKILQKDTENGDEFLQKDTNFHIEHVETLQKDTKFGLSCESFSIFQQTRNSIPSESYKMTPLEDPTKELCYSTNKIYTNDSPLHDLSTHDSTFEDNFENIFSPVFHKLHYQNLIPKNTFQSNIFKEKPILNSFKLLSQSTPKLQNYANTKENESQYNEKIVLCHSNHIANPLNESLSLQPTQIDIDKSQKLQRVESDVLSEIFFRDTKKQNNSSISESTQLISNNLSIHKMYQNNENLKNDADNLAFVNASQHESYESLSFLNHSQLKQEASISFINISSDSSNLNESSSEKTDEFLITNNCVKQSNNQSSLIDETTKLKPDKKTLLIYEDCFKLNDYSQIANDKELNGIFKKKQNLSQDSPKLALEDDFQSLKDEDCLQKANNTMLDKSSISPKSLPVFSNESSKNPNESLFAVLLSDDNDDESKLMSTTLSDQDLLTNLTFTNESITFNENDSNHTLHSFEKSYLGQFEIQTTFLNDSNDNQSKY